MIAYGNFGPPTKRCECTDRHIVIQEPYRPAVDLCAACGGWFRLRITSQEELDDFMQWVAEQKP